MLVSEQGLFRQETRQSRNRAWLGEIVMISPPSRWLWGAFAGLIALCFVLFLLFGQYTRRERVVGQVVPSSGLLNVAAVSTGAVARLYVRDGQVVRRGDPLLEVSSERNSTDLGDVHALIGKKLADKRGRLEADFRTQQVAARQQTQALQEKIELLYGQLQQAELQIVIQRQQVESGQNLLDRIQPLEKDRYISIFEIERQQSAVRDAHLQYNGLVRLRLDLRQQLADAKEQLSKLPLDAAVQHNQIAREISDVAESLAQNEMERAVLFRAQADGVVSTVLIKTGQMVSAGQPMLSLLPADATLQAQILVPGRAIGFISPGTPVMLRYAAFPYQKFGQQRGRVMEISRSALSPAEVTTLTGQVPPENEGPLYRVQVALDRQYVLVFGKQEPIKPGAAFEADVLIERRRLVEWLFEPLYGIRERLKEAG